MENNPKKSKALIITVSFVILLLLIFGYYLFRNRSQIFDAKGSTSVSKIFEPLLGTSKNRGLETVDNNSGIDAKKIGTVTTDDKGNQTVSAEAGEDIKKGDAVYISGFDKNGNPIVKKAIANDKDKSLVLGIAQKDIKKGDKGNILISGNLEMVAMAGESLINGDLVSIAGYDANGNPIIMKTTLGNSNANSLIFTVTGSIAKGAMGNMFVNVNFSLGTDGLGTNGLGTGGLGTNGLGTGGLGTNGLGTGGLGTNGLGTNGFGTSGFGEFGFNPISIPVSPSNRCLPPKVLVDGICKDPNIDTRPDLIAGPITPTTTTVNTGTKMYSTFSNIGGSSTKVKFPGFFAIATKNNAGVQTTIKTMNVSIPTLEANSSYNMVTPETYKFTSVGTYYVRACADLNVTSNKGVIEESNEENNCGAWTTVTVTEPLVCVLPKVIIAGICIDPSQCLPPKITDTETGQCIDPSQCLPPKIIVDNECRVDTRPDLIAGSITPTTTTVNTETKMYSTFSNIGGSSTKVKFPGFFAIATKNNAGVQTTIKTMNVSIPTLEANSSYNMVTPETYKFTSVGTYYVRACADLNVTSNKGVIEESNEENNCGAWTTVVVSEKVPGVCANVTKVNYPDCDQDGICTDKTKVNYPDCDQDGICTDKTKVNYPDCDQDGICTDKTKTNYPDCNEGANKCSLIDQNPLLFTTEQQGRLAELLRKFYLLAPKIRTIDDITNIYSEMDQYKSFATQIDGLTNQCKIEKGSIEDPVTKTKRTYLYPTTEQGGPGYNLDAGNPWYRSSERGTYLTDKQIPRIDPKAAGFCYGIIKQGPSTGSDRPGQNCNQFITADSCVSIGLISQIKMGRSLLNGTIVGDWTMWETIPKAMTGCEWIDLRQYEGILNVW